MIFPLGNLYKTQVRKLQSTWSCHHPIVNKPMSPRFWRGQRGGERDRSWIWKGGFDPSRPYWTLTSNRRRSLSEGRVSLDDIVRVLKLVQRSEHKRTDASSPSVHNLIVRNRNARIGGSYLSCRWYAQEGKSRRNGACKRRTSCLTLAEEDRWVRRER